MQILNSDSGQTHTVTKRLDNGAHEFIIKDDFSDGLCCDEVEGGHTTTINRIKVSSGREFGCFQQDTYDFNECDDETSLCDDSDDCTKDNCADNACICTLFPCDKCDKIKVLVGKGN